MPPLRVQTWTPGGFQGPGLTVRVNSPSVNEHKQETKKKKRHPHWHLRVNLAQMTLQSWNWQTLPDDSEQVCARYNSTPHTLLFLLWTNPLNHRREVRKKQQQQTTTWGVEEKTKITFLSELEPPLTIQVYLYTVVSESLWSLQNSLYFCIKQIRFVSLITEKYVNLYDYQFIWWEIRVSLSLVVRNCGRTWSSSSRKQFCRRSGLKSL